MFVVRFPIRLDFRFMGGCLTASFRSCLISSLVGSVNMFINIGFGTFDPHSAEAIAGLVLACVLILGFGMVVALSSASVVRPAGPSGNRREPGIDMLSAAFPKDKIYSHVHLPNSLDGVFPWGDLSRTEVHCEVLKPECCHHSVSGHSLYAGPYTDPFRDQIPRH